MEQLLGYAFDLKADCASPKVGAPWASLGHCFSRYSEGA
jgi:hypothetical protein